jgi:hypothetical protein
MLWLLKPIWPKLAFVSDPWLLTFELFDTTCEAVTVAMVLVPCSANSNPKKFKKENPF